MCFIVGARVVVDDARAAGVVAVLGRVGDRVAHARQALLVHQVDDQLQLVQALEVRHLRVVAGLDQRLEAGLDERAGAAAQDGLLAEEVGLGLVLEGRLEDAAARAADALGVGERERLGVAGRVLVDRDQAGDARALEVLAADEVARALGRDERDVDVRRRARPRRRGSRSRDRRAAGCRARGCRRRRPRRRRGGARRGRASSRGRRVAAASATARTSSPASRAWATLSELSRRPTTTLTPESLRFSAWAWPCEPKPMIATVLPSRSVRSASSS